MAFAAPPPSPQQDLPTIERTPKEYVAPVVDTRATNYNTLSTFAAGSKWACDFYVQKVARDTAPGAYTPDQLPIYGQYTRIRGFELLVTSPMQPQQSDSLSRSFTVTGTASVYSVVTANEGDVFIADVGDGRNGLFLVTKSTRSAPYTESMITIDFKQLSILNADTEADLNSRVIETVYFDRELLRGGVNPIIKESVMHVNRRLMKAYRRLTNVYLHEFIDTRHNTLILPGQSVATYDPHMTRFVLRVLDKSVCKRLGEVLELGVGHQSTSRVLTVLDAIESVDVDLLFSVARTVEVTSIKDYRARPYLYSIANSQIDQVVIVTDSSYTRDTVERKGVGIGPLADAGVRRPLQRFMLPTTVGADPVPDKPSYIHPVPVDDYYIFSEAFYNDTEGQSDLENIVLKRLSGEAFSLEILADIADNADGFDNLERFYYIPVILAMIKMSPGVV